MQLNVLNDLAEAMKALDGKKTFLKGLSPTAWTEDVHIILQHRRCPRGSVGWASFLTMRTDCRWWFDSHWSASKPQVVTRRKATGAGQKKHIILQHPNSWCGLLWSLPQYFHLGFDSRGFYSVLELHLLVNWTSESQQRHDRTNRVCRHFRCHRKIQNRVVSEKIIHNTRFNQDPLNQTSNPLPVLHPTILDTKKQQCSSQAVHGQQPRIDSPGYGPRSWHGRRVSLNTATRRKAQGGTEKQHPCPIFQCLESWNQASYVRLFCDEVPVFVFTDGACEPEDDGSYLAGVTSSSIVMVAWMGL